MLLLFITIIISLILILILHLYFSKHYWYKVHQQLQKNPSQNKFFTNSKFNNNSIFITSVSQLNPSQFNSLYKNYLPSFSITTSSAQKFLQFMPNPSIIIKKLNEKYIGSVFNCLTTIHFKNSIQKILFVDYAVINHLHRHQNIFQGLMNNIALYANKNNCNSIFFKIDLKPIPSFSQYKFISNYFLTTSKKLSNINPTNFPIIPANPNDIQINCFFNNLKLFPTKDLLQCILQTGWGYKINNKIVILGKNNSPVNAEILYIIFLEKTNQKDLKNLFECFLSYLGKTSQNIMIDNIGFNILMVESCREYWEELHRTYHYMVGFEGDVKREDFYYYF